MCRNSTVWKAVRIRYSMKMTPDANKGHSLVLTNFEGFDDLLEVHMNQQSAAYRKYLFKALGFFTVRCALDARRNLCFQYTPFR